MVEINSRSGSGTGCLNTVVWFLGLNIVWLLLAVFTAWLGFRSYTLSVDGEVVTGTVVRLLEDEPSSYTSDIYPIVEFEVDGEIYSVQSQNNYRWWNRYTRFPVGRQVEMRYDPANPQKAEVNSWLDLWGEVLILGLFTVVTAIGVNAFLLHRWRRGRSAQPAAGS